MQVDMSNKRVLVTGGSSGIGRAVATAFASAGSRVAVNYIRDPVPADRLVEGFRGGGHVAIAVEGDVCSPEAVASIYTKLDAEWGGLDVLINNAGIDGPRAMAWESEAEEWSRVIDVNLKGAYLCAREALTRMVQQRSGVIVNVSSVHERIAWSGFSAYCASKAGLSMMAQTMAQEAAPYGVRVLCIAPGAIKTPINEAVWKDPQGRADLLTKIPLGRIGEPEDVARMAVLLASDLAAYVTATTVFVDGGMTDYPGFSHGG